MPFGSLWLSVLVSAIVVFVASSVLHMALKYHKHDYRAIPNENAVREALGKGRPAPGQYMTPHCENMSETRQPAVKEKFDKGPVALIVMYPNGLPNMGRHLSLWFGFCVLVSFVAAYVARHTLMPGADGLLVMRITGAVAFAAYAVAPVSDSIWKGQPWSNTMRFVIDGAIYSILTGITFRLLWPAA